MFEICLISGFVLQQLAVRTAPTVCSFEAVAHSGTLVLGAMFKLSYLLTY